MMSVSEIAFPTTIADFDEESIGNVVTLSTGASAFISRTNSGEIKLTVVNVNGEKTVQVAVSDPSENALYPRLAILSDGNLAISYTNFTFLNGLDYDHLITKIVSASGQILTPGTRIDSPRRDDLQTSDIVALEGGGYVVYAKEDWNAVSGSTSSFSVFNNAAMPTSDVMELYSFKAPLENSGAALIDGGFVLSALSTQDASGFRDVVFGVFNPDGSPRTDFIRVNEDSGGSQFNQAIGVLENGNIVFAWAEYFEAERSVFIRIISPDGVPASNPVEVTTVPDGVSLFSTGVTTLPDGGFLTTWQSYEEGVPVISVRRYDEIGRAITDVVNVPSDQEFDTRFSSYSVNDNGQLSFFEAASFVERVNFRDVYDTELRWSLTDLYPFSSSGNDSLSGTDQDDVLFGLSGDDTFFSSEGNDYLYGGMGLDIVHYSGTRDEHSVSFGMEGNNTIIFSTSTGAADDLTSIERVTFDDATLAIDLDGNAGQIYRLYEAAFDRKPDIEGLTFWINMFDGGDLSLEQVALNFIDSLEFTLLYGSNVSDSEFIDLLYQNVLDRSPDLEGLSFWNEQAELGLSREAILSNFSESRENIENVSSQISGGIWYGLA